MEFRSRIARFAYGFARRRRVTALNLDDREPCVIGPRSRLQLDGLIHRPLSLIEAVKSQEIRGKRPIPPPGPERLGHECLARKLDRLVHLTVNRELTPEIELRLGVIGRELQRAPILRFGSAPVEVGCLKQITSGIVGGRKVG